MSTEAGVFCSRPLAGLQDAEALNLVGASLHREGRLEESAEALGNAVRLEPRNPRYRISLAATLGRLGRHHEAIGELVAALAVRGNIPELHNNLGASLEKLGRFDEAAAALRNALNLRANYFEAHRNLGNVLRALGRPGEAVAEYEAALKLRPQDADSLAGLSSAATDLGDADRAIECCREVIRLAPDSPSARSSMLYTIHYCPEYDAAALWDEHRQWSRLFCDPLKHKIAPHDNDRTPDRRLRIGYVSPDFREQTVPYFITAALRYHDRENFEVFCYSDVEKPDAVTERLKGIVEHWHENRGQSHETVAARIRADRIDILVDLRGHAAANRLPMFCLKPAPVQVSMVGYFDTTGLWTMDYRITDDLQDPVGTTDQYHTEKLVRLAGSCWCYTADPDSPDVAETPALRNGYVTFGSLNKIVKVSEPCGRLWARVLEAAPGSRLVVSMAGADAGGTVRRRLESFGIPSDRQAGRGRHLCVCPEVVRDRYLNQVTIQR